MNGSRLAGVLASFFLIASCGGGGGSGAPAPASTSPPAASPPVPPPPPPPPPSFAGMWSATDPQGIPVTAFSTDSGVFHWSGDQIQTGIGMGLQVSVSGNSVSMTLSLPRALGYDDGSRSAICTAAGTFEERVSIDLSGTCTTTEGTAFDLSMAFTYDSQYERASSLDEISGMYRVGGDILTIDTLGLLYLQMAGLGCVVNGEVSIIEPQWNAYEANVTYANCLEPLSVFNDVPMTGTVFIHEASGSDRIVAVFSGGVGIGIVSLFFYADRI